MDVGAESAGTGVAPTPAPPAAQTALAVSSAEAAGGSKFGVDAVVLDLGKVLPLPAGQERKEGALDDAAARGEGECASVVVDIKGEGAKGLGDGDGVIWDSEKMCRICHVSPERREVSEGSELIQLGCGCKNELGVAHRHCAEAWFKLKGNRLAVAAHLYLTEVVDGVGRVSRVLVGYCNGAFAYVCPVGYSHHFPLNEHLLRFVRTFAWGDVDNDEPVIEDK